MSVRKKKIIKAQTDTVEDLQGGAADLVKGTEVQVLTAKDEGPGYDLAGLSLKGTQLAEKRRGEIVAGACRLFFEKGYHSTSIREIATAAKMSMGQLYHYAPSKNHVLYLVHAHTQALWIKHMRSANVDEIKEPREKLRKALYHSMEFVEGNKEMFRFLLSESRYLDKVNLSAVLDLYAENLNAYWQHLVDEASAPQERKRDMGFDAGVIATLVLFPATGGWTMKGKQSSKQVIEYLVNFILQATGAM